MAQANERRAVDERAIELLWRSADGQGEIPMGTYRTEQEALAAISGARAELLAQCPDDDDQTDHIHAGRWVVVLPEDERDERRADERRYLVAVRLLGAEPETRLFAFSTPVARESFLVGLKAMYPASTYTYATAEEN